MIRGRRNYIIFHMGRNFLISNWASFLLFFLIRALILQHYQTTILQDQAQPEEWGFDGDFPRARKLQEGLNFQKYLPCKNQNQRKVRSNITGTQFMRAYLRPLTCIFSPRSYAGHLYSPSSGQIFPVITAKIQLFRENKLFRFWKYFKYRLCY